MQIVGTISSLLGHKGTTIWSIGPEATVFEALEMMAEKNVGGLLVISGGELVGMVAERDYSRKVALKGKNSHQTQVREIMVSPVISVTSQHTIEDCMRIMTENKVRHLPVLEEKKVLGIVSIGDLVNWTISAQTTAIQQLESYISGTHSG